MLPNILSQQALRRVRTEIPDARLVPYGGPWGARIPDANADHRELTEYDRTVPPAADLLAFGAPSRDVAERPTDIVQNRAIRIKSSGSLSQSDMETVMSIVRDGATPTNKAALLSIAKRHLERRLQSVSITRGILLAGLACGDLTWAQGGIVTGSLDFGMPASLKLVPGTYWLSNVGTVNVGATPVSDLIALDVAAQTLGGAPFDAVDMSRALFNAMIQTTEYQNQAKALSSVYQTGSLPVAGSDAAIQLASRVLGKVITIVDNTFEYENADGSRTTGRYVPPQYVVPYHLADVGQSINWDFANCPSTESAVAAIGGSTVFGGDVVRGPVSYVTADERDFAWVKFNATQEGSPRRHSRTVSGRITAVQP